MFCSEVQIIIIHRQTVVMELCTDVPIMTPELLQQVEDLDVVKHAVTISCVNSPGKK